MIEKLLAKTDFFIHPKIIKNDDGKSHFKARIFVLVLFLMITIFSVNLFYSFLNKTLNSYFEIAYCLIIVSFLISIKIFGNIRLLVHIMCLASVILLVVQVTERGGIYSSDLFWMGLIITWICVITGITDGLIWFIISIFIFAGFYYFDDPSLNYDYEIKTGAFYALVNLVSVSLGIFIFIALYETKSNNLLKEINDTNKIISSKNYNIEMSIEYAKRIQLSSLPKSNYLEALFRHHFIYFKPKDIIGGDFYAAYVKNNHTIIICADCTGHGVSGAMLSTFGITSLNQIINEKGITEPNSIVYELSARLKSLFQEDQSELKDGMDLSVISINHSTQQLSFFGAGRPIYILRQESIFEFKKQSNGIGGFYKIDKADKLPNQILKLEKKDTIYMYTDGVSDQFGGSKQNKLSNKMLINYFKSLQLIAESDKEKAFEKFMSDWMQDTRQVDDMLLICMTV
jgi:serine phosphatase RsbU (regulator of sigma subunit)